MVDTALRAGLKSALIEQELSGGGWSYGLAATQAALEPTCLALLALRWDSNLARALGLKFLLRMQNPDGSWPAFSGDDSEGSGLTALAVIAHQQRRDGTSNRARSRMAAEIERKRITLVLAMEV